MLPIREELVVQLDTLSDEQIAALLELVKVMRPNQPLPEYDEAHDPLLTGELTFSAAPNFAEQAEDILEKEMGIGNDLDGNDA